MRVKITRAICGFITACMCVFMYSPAAYALNSKPVTVALPSVSQRTAGAAVPANQIFSFTLTSQNGAPMPQSSTNGSKTITVTDTAAGSFGTVEYTAQGQYSYTVHQTTGLKPYYSYDKTVYTVNVLIEKSNNGVMSSTVWVSRPDVSGKQNAVLFENGYSVPQPPITTPPAGTVPQTGDEFNTNGWLAVAVISGVSVLFAALKAKKRKKENIE